MARSRRKNDEQLEESNDSSQEETQLKDDDKDVCEEGIEVVCGSDIPQEIDIEKFDPDPNDDAPDLEELFEDYENSYGEGVIYADIDYNEALEQLGCNEESINANSEEDISDEEFEKIMGKIREQMTEQTEEECTDYVDDYYDNENVYRFDQYLRDQLEGDTVVVLTEKMKKIGLGVVLGTVGVVAYLLGKSRRY